MSVLPVSIVDDNGDAGGGNQYVGRILVCRGVDCAGIQHACAHACLRRLQGGSLTASWKSACAALCRRPRKRSDADGDRGALF